MTKARDLNDADMSKVPERGGFDIDALLEEADTAKMVVANPADDRQPVLGADGKPWTITFAGPNHPQTLKVRRAIQIRTFKAERERRSNEAVQKLADSADERNIGDLVERTLGWSPVIRGGEPFEFSPANAKMVWTSTIMRIQANEFLNEEANFMKASSTPS